MDNLSRKGVRLMKKTIAIVNKKGGVGKTTTALNLAAGLSKEGKRVLLIDLDQQANLSFWLNYEFDGKPTIAEMIMFSVSGMYIDYNACIRHFSSEGFDYIPALSASLDGIPSYLAGKNDCTNILKKLLTKLHCDDNIIKSLVRHNKIAMERYRSGHNGAVLKTVCLHGRMGSNPILSAENHLS